MTTKIRIEKTNPDEPDLEVEIISDHSVEKCKLDNVSFIFVEVDEHTSIELTEVKPTVTPATLFVFELGETVKYKNINGKLVGGKIVSRTEHINDKPMYRVKHDGYSIDHIPEYRLLKC